jgi:multiple sugar transport system permease protein
MQLIKEIKNNKASYVLMAPYLLFFTLFTITPVIMAIVLSFTQYDMLQPPRFIGLSNYIRMFLDDDIFIIAITNTMVFAFIVGPVSYALCFVVAWLINELGRTLRSIATSLFYIPTVVGATGWVIWRLLLSPDQYGLINGMLMKFGIVHEPIAWLLDKKYILPVLIMVQLWLSLGISFLAFVAGLQTIDKSLYEAGVIDGIRNRFQELWYITLPSMIPQLAFGAVMQIISSFSVADVSIELAGFPSTGYAGETVVTHIMDYGNIRYEFGYACAMAVVLVSFMVCTNKVVSRLLNKVGK